MATCVGAACVAVMLSFCPSVLRACDADERATDGVLHPSADDSVDAGDVGFGDRAGRGDEDEEVDAIDPFRQELDDDSDDEDDDEDEDATGSEASDDIEHMDEDEMDEDDEDDEDGDGEDEGQESDEEDDIMGHMEQLELLKKKDPKFYEFLKENDQTLLDFGPGEDEDAEEGEGNGDDDEEEEEADGVTRVTIDMIKSWKTTVAKNKSMRTIRKILLAYRAAAAVGDTDATGEYSYIVEEGKTFNYVVLTALKYAPAAFNKFLYGADEPDRIRKGLPSSAKKWRKVHTLIKSFLSSTLKFMQRMTDKSMLGFLLKQSDAAVPYFACFPKLGKDFVKQLLSYWSRAEDEQTRILAFLCLRRLAISAPNPYLQTVIKGSYTTFVEVSRVTTVHTWTQLSFMANCLVELSGIHLPTTYQLMFVYIRQMAIQLRAAVTNKTKESYKAVYNWPFLHSIRLWTQALSTYCSKDIGDTKDTQTLQPLIYPIVQVMIGVIRLKPSSKYFPFRLQMIRALIDLGRATGTFIPVSSYLFDIFMSAEMTGHTKPSTIKPLDFALTIKAPNSYLGTRTYRKSLTDEVVHLLFNYYTTLSLSISFPELVIPAIMELRLLSKKHSKDMQIKKQFQSLIEKLEQNSKFIEQQRSQIEFGPKDIGRASEFLGHMAAANESPLGKYNAARLRLRDRQKPQDLVVPDHQDNDSDQEPSAGAKGGRRAPRDEDEDGDEDEEMDDGGDEDEEEEDEEEEEEPVAKKPKAAKGKAAMGKAAMGKAGNGKKGAAAAATAMDVDDDIVEDFVLSDDE
ncbi:Noc2p family-domain-containing protein [Entophlyctis helioformis]|nr:Noc2p family-domain-containing protein [Entophlyctis helioformis]